MARVADWLMTEGFQYRPIEPGGGIDYRMTEVMDSGSVMPGVTRYRNDTFTQIGLFQAHFFLELGGAAGGII